MNTSVPKFSPGQCMATPGVLEALSAAGEVPDTYLDRHVCGDWGDVDQDDKQANEDALLSGDRLLSAYHLSTGVKVWIITEAVGQLGEREVTTLLLPEEY